MAKTVTMRAKGKKPVRFKSGGLHESVGVPSGEKIPEEKIRSAASGNYGERARKQAVMAKGMLRKGRRTAARNRSRR